MALEGVVVRAGHGRPPSDLDVVVTLVRQDLLSGLLTDVAALGEVHNDEDRSEEHDREGERVSEVLAHGHVQVTGGVQNITRSRQTTRISIPLR